VVVVLAGVLVVLLVVLLVLRVPLVVGVVGFVCAWAIPKASIAPNVKINFFIFISFYCGLQE
jgi:hypothetical protein